VYLHLLNRVLKSEGDWNKYLTLEMDAEIDAIVRSRPTLLKILEKRGYDVSSQVNTSPETIYKLGLTDPVLLNFTVTKKADSLAPVNNAHVIYHLQPIRLRVAGLVEAILEDESLTAENDEWLHILTEPYNEVFDVTAAKQWNIRKIRMNFYPVKSIITDPTTHVLVPPHRKLTPAEIETVMAALSLKSKTELPHIKFHRDMTARVLGLAPGDIVEITRPSETAGSYTMYRVCTL
jgi:DNA-directed RNA polymerase subunit H (RpoH/RPB5)